MALHFQGVLRIPKNTLSLRQDSWQTSYTAQCSVPWARCCRRLDLFHISRLRSKFVSPHTVLVLPVVYSFKGLDQSRTTFRDHKRYAIRYAVLSKILVQILFHLRSPVIIGKQKIFFHVRFNNVLQKLRHVICHQLPRCTARHDEVWVFKELLNEHQWPKFAFLLLQAHIQLGDQTAISAHNGLRCIAVHWFFLGWEAKSHRPFLPLPR